MNKVAISLSKPMTMILLPVGRFGMAGQSIEIMQECSF